MKIRRFILAFLAVAICESLTGKSKQSQTLQIYQQEVLRLLLKEANQVAGELQLPEKLPITETNLVERFISPPRFAREYQAMGNVSTRDFCYCVAVGNKFSYVIGRHQAQDCARWEKSYLWPLSRIDTNAAYKLAVRWFKAVSIDVDSLNRDHHLRIEPDKIYIRTPSDKFVPVYWVGWYKKHVQNPDIITSNPSEWEAVASVFLFLPEQTLLQLRVEDSKYILRQPLEIPNVNLILSRTNSPPAHVGH